ncbi:MAG: DUF6128 domain-containing protein [Ruminococcus sp.]|jgi:hypothetical protein
MSDYRRFISYLYEYKNGQKTQNRGFLKAESRNNICKLEIYIKDTALSANLPIDIYGFTRTENQLSGIFLGSVRSGNGSAGCCIKTASNNLNQTSVSFSDLRGIIILCSGTVCYASAWDDLPIIVKDFVKAGQKPSSSEPEEPVLEAEEIKNPEKSETEIREDTPESSDTDSRRWEQLLKHHEAFQPFTDGFLSQCVKLSIQDFAALRKERWMIGSNPFIACSFSRHHHIILGKTSENEKCILGVPGTYHPKEKFMAEMYGFPYFRAIKFPADISSSFGYWYRFLN